VQSEQKRRFFSAAGSIGFGILLFLLLGELAVRIIAGSNPTIRYLATAGAIEHPLSPATLEEYLRSREPHIVPHRVWLRHRANSLGFYDKEFATSVSAQSGRQILALGDSFLYGLVDLDLNVMTLLEKILRERCKTPELDIFNTGNPSAEVWDYLTLYKLLSKRINADTVLIHFYLGNDGPNLLKGRTHVSAWRKFWRKSFLYSFTKNSVRLLSVAKNDPLSVVGSTGDPSTNPLQAPSTRPKEVFRHELDEEIGRFFHEPNATLEAQAWSETEGLLKELFSQIRSDGRKPILVFYPSQLQFSGRLFQSARERAAKKLPIDAKDFQQDYPAKKLTALCNAEKVHCIELTERLNQPQKARVEPLYIHGDTHWSISGNAAAAEAEADLLAPLICP